MSISFDHQVAHVSSGDTGKRFEYRCEGAEGKITLTDYVISIPGRERVKSEETFYYDQKHGVILRGGVWFERR